MGAGKDTAAEGLLNLGWVRVAFADPLREMMVALNPIVSSTFDREGLMEGIIEHRLVRIVAKIGWDRAKREVPEIRALLQRLGTEAGRGVLGENVWVEQAMKTAMRFKNPVVFTDVRFPNEVEMIHNIGGMVVHIERPGQPRKQMIGHASEGGIEGSWDTEIINDGTIEELQHGLARLVESTDFWDGNYAGNVRARSEGM